MTTERTVKSPTRKASKGDGETHLRQVRSGGKVRVQRSAVRKDGWTAEKRAAFFAHLAETCNVAASARHVGMSVPMVYALRKRDAAFAAEWMEALDQGFEELRIQLLHQARFGIEETSHVTDADGNTKQITTKHSYPVGMSLRLLLAHQQAVMAFRAQQGIVRQGSEDVLHEIMEKLALARKRAKAQKARTANMSAGVDPQ